MIQIKNAKDAAQAILGFVLIGGIAIPGIAQGVSSMNHVEIAMSGEKIGTYNCSNRTFNPMENTTVGKAATSEWIDEREFGAAMNGGVIGNIITNGVFNRFDEICDAR